MLHGSTGRFFLLFCSSSAFARALISLVALSMSAVYSPTSTTVISPPWQQQARAASTKKHQPHAHHLPSGVVEDNKDRLQLLLVAPPPPAPSFFTSREREEETTKKNKKAPGGGRAISRPPRLVIPPAPRAAAAGVDPFGAAVDRETDVATEVEVQGEGFCLASRRGVRHSMEDGYDVITTSADEKGGGIGGRSSQLAFYGVYDGHGGRAAVDFVADKLGKNVVAAAASSCRRHEEEGGGGDDEVIMVAAIRSAYLTTDSKLLSQGIRGGTCAATALVKDYDLYVANVGDCRAVLGSSSIAGGVAATELTTDHTAGHEGERRRVEAQGGYVSRGSTGVWRVQDSLAVTRAFGDASLKPCGVTAEPEVSRRRITPDCRFLVLASDGLWNKVSSQEAVDVVVSANAASDGSHQACKELVATARSRGSRDDVTVMVVDLQRFLLHR